MMLTASWKDSGDLVRLGNAMGRLSSDQQKTVEMRAVNRVGQMAKTQVARALAKQTGLPKKSIMAAIKTKKAYAKAETIEYVMSTEGGDISLKYLNARETRAGVTASPFGVRQLFPGSFIKGGRFPNRVTAKGLHGHVYRRTGGKTRTGKAELEMLNSGVIIPEQMVTGETLAIFNKTVESHLTRRVMHEIQHIAPGIFD